MYSAIPGRRLVASLRARLLLLVFVALLPALALVAHHGIERRQEAIERAYDDALRLARLAAVEQHRRVDDIHLLLSDLAQSDIVRNGSSSSCGERLSPVVSRRAPFTTVFVAKPDGEVVCSTQPLPGPLNLAGQRAFEHVHGVPEFSVGDVVVGRLTGRAVLLMTYPVIENDGTVVAVLQAGLDMGWLSSFAD